MNRLLLPGGDVDLQKSEYSKAAKIFYDLAIEVGLHVLFHQRYMLHSPSIHIQLQWWSKATYLPKPGMFQAWKQIILMTLKGSDNFRHLQIFLALSLANIKEIVTFDMQYMSGLQYPGQWCLRLFPHMGNLSGYGAAHCSNQQQEPSDPDQHRSRCSSPEFHRRSVSCIPDFKCKLESSALNHVILLKLNITDHILFQ